MRRREIDPATLRRLYLDDHRTTPEIASALRCGATTIRRRLRAYGIDVRPRGPEPGRARGWTQSWSPTRSWSWSPQLAYAVGVIATDGYLGRDGRTLDVSSKDVDLLDRASLGLDAPIRRRSSGNKTCFRLDWRDPVLHRWLCDIGLMPAKSLRLGPLAVPDEWFPDFLRGCIDGDGSIVTYTDRWHTAKNPAYVYERLYVSLVSASPPFLHWINDTAARLIGVRATVWQGRGRRCALLRYPMKKSRAIIRWIYYRPDLPCLARKRLKALPFLDAPLLLK